jgi:hypothetical protein
MVKGSDMPTPKIRAGRIAAVGTSASESAIE